MSFYKDLARIRKAKELNLEVDEYVKYLRMAKSGKFNVVYNSKKTAPSAKKRAITLDTTNRFKTGHYTNDGKRNQTSLFQTEQSVSHRKQTEI